MTKDQLTDYFRTLHRLGRQRADEWFAVLHPGAPKLVNKLEDFAHRLGMRAAWRELEAERKQHADFAVLELGCGTGRWTKELARRGFHVFAVDISEDALAFVKEGVTHRVACCDVTAIPFSSHTFDAALSVTVIQHLPYREQERAVAEVKRVLKPGGTFILLENCHDKAPHVFSRDITGWVSLLSQFGFEPVVTARSNYLLAKRAVLRLHRGARHRSQPSSPAVASPTAGRRLKALLNTSIALVDFPLEFLAWVLQASFSTHVLLVAKSR